MRISDWSSDVCSSDLQTMLRGEVRESHKVTKFLVAPLFFSSRFGTRSKLYGAADCAAENLLLNRCHKKQAQPHNEHMQHARIQHNNAKIAKASCRERVRHAV